MIGGGNQAVCDFSDYIDVLVDDKRITAIGLSPKTWAMFPPSALRRPRRWAGVFPSLR